MEAELLKAASGAGVFAVLFVALFFYVLKKNDEREQRLMAHNEGYQKALGDISAGQQRLTDAVTEMRSEISEVKEEIAELKRA